MFDGNQTPAHERAGQAKLFLVSQTMSTDGNIQATECGGTTPTLMEELLYALEYGVNMSPDQIDEPMTLHLVLTLPSRAS